MIEISFNSGSKATFELHENITVSGGFGCSSGELKHFCINNLQTAIGMYPSSLLRASDIICVHFQEHNIPLNDLVSESIFTHISSDFGEQSNV